MLRQALFPQKLVRQEPDRHSECTSASQQLPQHAQLTSQLIFIYGNCHARHMKAHCAALPYKKKAQRRLLRRMIRCYSIISGREQRQAVRSIALAFPLKQSPFN